MKFGTYFACRKQEWDKVDYVFYFKKAAALGFDVLEAAAASLWKTRVN